MAQSGTQMIKPDAIDRLPFLDEPKKLQYRNGLASLWHTYNTHPEGSSERNAAEQKIRNASAKLMAELANSTRGKQGQAQPQQNNGGGGGGVGGQALAQAQQQQQQRPPTQGSASVQPGNGQPQQAGNAGQASTLSPAAQNDIRSVQIVLPLNVPPEQEAKYRAQWMQQAINIMRQRDAWIAKGKQVHAQIQQMNASNQPVPPQAQQMLDEAKKGVNEATGKWNGLKADNERKRQAKVAAQAAGQSQSMQQPPPPQNTTKPQPPEMQRTNTAGSINGVQPVKTEARASNSPSQPLGGVQQQHQPNTSQPAPAQAATNMPQQAPQQQQQHAPQVQRPPQSATQPQPPQNYMQQQQQYQNQQQRQMHPQTQQQQQNMQHSQPPPQQSLQNPPQRPQVPHALSHGDAVAQAQAQYAQQQQQQPSTQPQSNAPHLPNTGIPFNSTSGQPTPTSAYPSQAAAAQNLHNAPNPNNKFPIQKQMQIDPRLSQPLPGPAARPTMNAAGMQNQPGLARPPPYTLEGEGDHVLSKRKLDELVRQVTGGASIPTTTNTATTANSADADTTTPTASFLDPAVEENILSLADDFVDDLITSACRLAKLRPDRMLDIKDIQIVLERNYGIRIPGYTLEETRTVRKFVPAVGWQGKMQAIQTAKTLGGVGGGGKAEV